MIRKYVDELVPGMVLARSVEIKDYMGKKLLERGLELSYEHIDNLMRWGITDVHVEEDLAIVEKDLENDFADTLKLLAVQARTCALSSVRDTVKLQTGEKHKNIKEMDRCVNLIVELLDLDISQLVKYSLTQPQEEYIFTHSVNVGVLSMVIGTYLELNKEQKRVLGESALLHDIGLIYVDHEYWDHVDYFEKGFTLSNIKKHIEEGVKILDKIEGIKPEVFEALKNHHEKLDGSGLPNGIDQRELNIFTKIVTVADMFESMTRPYDPELALNSHEALKYIFNSMEKYDQRILKGFLGDLAMFPIGSVVKLSSGHVALVIATRKDQPFRPKLRVITDERGIKLTEPYELDIADKEYALTYIEKTLKTADIKFSFSWE